MRDYGKVHTSFWSSDTIGSLSEDSRVLALYLLTSPHSTISGVFRLPDGYALEDLKWSAERVKKGFDELLAKGFANRCETTKWVWVFKHLDWNPPENPNQRKSAKKIALTVPDQCAWKLDFMRARGESLDISEDEFPKPCETVPKPFLNQEQEQKQEQEISAEQTTLVLVGDPVVENPVAELMLVTGSKHPVYAEQVDSWCAAYPAVDVLGELKKMDVWLVANTRNRKTERGINAFVVTWLSRQQDGARKSTGTRGPDTDEFGIRL